MKQDKRTIICNKAFWTTGNYKNLTQEEFENCSKNCRQTDNTDCFNADGQPNKFDDAGHLTVFEEYLEDDRGNLIFSKEDWNNKAFVECLDLDLCDAFIGTKHIGRFRYLSEAVAEIESQL